MTSPRVDADLRHAVARRRKDMQTGMMSDGVSGIVQHVSLQRVDLASGRAGQALRATPPISSLPCSYQQVAERHTWQVVSAVSRCPANGTLRFRAPVVDRAQSRMRCGSWIAGGRPALDNINL